MRNRDYGKKSGGASKVACYANGGELMSGESDWKWGNSSESAAPAKSDDGASKVAALEESSRAEKAATVSAKEEPTVETPKASLDDIKAADKDTSPVSKPAAKKAAPVRKAVAKPVQGRGTAGRKASDPMPVTAAAAKAAAPATSSAKYWKAQLDQVDPKTLLPRKMANGGSVGGDFQAMDKMNDERSKPAQAAKPGEVSKEEVNLNSNPKGFVQGFASGASAGSAMMHNQGKTTWVDSIGKANGGMIGPKHYGKKK